MIFKRVVSFMCTSALLLSLWAMPAKAAPMSVETGYSFLVNDSFDTDLGGWRLSEAKEDYEGSVSLATEDGASVMKVVASSNMNKNLGAKGEQTAVHRDMPKEVIYENGSYIYIKTRFKHSNPLFRTYIKYNRPYALAKVDPSECGLNLYSLVCANGNGAFSIKQGTAGGGIQDGLETLIKGVSSGGVSLVDKWFDVTIKFDGYNKTADFTVIDETTGITHVAANASLVSPKWEDAFKSLAFYFRSNNTENDSDTLYVDYVQVYETGPATGAIVNNSVYPHEDIKLKLITNISAAVVPNDAVTLVNSENQTVSAQVSYDAAAKTFTVNPDEDLVPGNTYRLKLNSEKMEDVGLTLKDSGVYSFSIRQLRPKAENVVISGRVIPGKVITASYKSFPFTSFL